MKTGFINAFANKPVKKTYRYHGVIRECPIQPNPEPFLPGETVPGEYVVVTFDYYGVTPTGANLVGVLIVAEGVGNFILRGFEYGPDDSYGENIWEAGSFPAGNYNMHIIY